MFHFIEQVGIWVRMMSISRYTVVQTQRVHKWTSSIGNTNLFSLCDTEEQDVLSQIIWRSESIWKNTPNRRKPSHCPLVGNVHV